MTNKIFLDSNLLIYLYSVDEAKKTESVQDLINKYDDLHISTQVLFEFSFVMHRKLKFNYEDIEKAVREFYEAFNIIVITYEMVLLALEIASRYKYSFPDSLIIATAIKSDCTILFSEDMHEHVVENSLKLVKPF